MVAWWFLFHSLGQEGNGVPSSRCYFHLRERAKRNGGVFEKNFAELKGLLAIVNRRHCGAQRQGRIIEILFTKELQDSALFFNHKCLHSYSLWRNLSPERVIVPSPGGWKPPTLLLRRFLLLTEQNRGADQSRSSGSGGWTEVPEASRKRQCF